MYDEKLEKAGRKITAALILASGVLIAPLALGAVLSPFPIKLVGFMLTAASFVLLYSGFTRLLRSLAPARVSLPERPLAVWSLSSQEWAAFRRLELRNSLKRELRDALILTVFGTLLLCLVRGAITRIAFYVSAAFALLVGAMRYWLRFRTLPKNNERPISIELHEKTVLIGKTRVALGDEIKQPRNIGIEKKGDSCFVVFNFAWKTRSAWAFNAFRLPIGIADISRVEIAIELIRSRRGISAGIERD